MYKPHPEKKTGVSAMPLVVMAILLMLGHGSAAQNKPLNPALIDQLKQKVKETATNSKSITSDFTQEKEMTLLAEKITSKGKFYFKKEKMLRWEYTDPFSYMIIIKNDQISVKDENNVSHYNVTTNKFFMEINRIILGSIQGTLLQDDKNFRAAFFDNPSGYVVRLYPLSQKLKESLSEITILFNHADFSVDRVDMHEPGGDRTRITFHNKAFNTPVPDEKFVAW